MKVGLAFVIGIICAAAGCVAAGLVAALSADWYRVPSMEGAAGYYVLFIALGGAVAGFLIGFIAALVILLRGRGFGVGLAAPLGIVLGIASASLGLYWLFADIPPTFKGEEMYVEVELMCPSGWQPAKKIRAGGNRISLLSIGKDKQVRRSTSAEIQIENAREGDGRTIIPASVFLFSSKGERGLTLTLADKEVAFFPMELPGKPNEEFERWSSWVPQSGAPGAKDAFQYRFRVTRQSVFRERQESAARLREEERERRVAAMPADAPIAEWLFLWDREAGWSDASGPNANSKIRQVLSSRMEELVPLTKAEDDETAARAMEMMSSLSPLPDEVEDQLVGALEPIRAKLERACAVYNADDPDMVAINALYARFSAWSNAWGSFRIQRTLPAPKELAPIAALEEKCPKYTILRSIAESARFDLENWQPQPEAVPSPQ